MLANRAYRTQPRDMTRHTSMIHIDRCALRVNTGGESVESAATWVFFHCMTKADHDALDAHLVSIKHPLAFEPGTQESRFRALVRQAVQQHDVSKQSND